MQATQGSYEIFQPTIANLRAEKHWQNLTLSLLPSI